MINKRTYVLTQEIKIDRELFFFPMDAITI
jgi:hypothetical protein